MRRLLILAVAAGLSSSGAASAGISTVINEFVVNHTGPDTHEFVEVFSAPNHDMTFLTIVEIEGDAGSTGLIDDGVFAVGVADASGFWCTGFLDNVLENGTLTLLLVTNYSGSVGHDIDLNDDGVIDNPAWGSIWDAVGVTDGGVGDLTYATVTLDSSLPPAGFTVGGASRIPNGYDSNNVSDWCRNDFDGLGLPGFTGSLDSDEAVNTYCTRNTKDGATPSIETSFGRIKAMYR
jgi:hypothetical protein